IYRAALTILLLSLPALISLFSINMLSSSAHAETVNYNVILDPSINIVLSTNTVALSLNPNTKTFDSTNLNVGVSTNNATGYHLVVTSPNDNTDLINTEDSTKTIATLPALSGGYDDDSFVVNKWGYKISGNPYTSTNNKYIPFVSGTTLNYNYTTTNNDTTALTFASKINYNQPSGTYDITLNFNAIANADIPYIQDYTAEMCQNQATDQEVVVQDKRDLKSYTVRYINGNCWMTQNLRFTESVLDSTTSNIASTYTAESPLIINWGDLTSGDSYTEARLHTGVDNLNNPTVWYNYAGASAMSITGSDNATEAEYSVCPSGWRLATYAEQTELRNTTGSNPSVFNPVYGGIWYGGSHSNITTRGEWWSSTAHNSDPTTQPWIFRRVLYYQSGTLNTNFATNRQYGKYIRCIRSASA
ncbi:hypothetical protein IKF23_01385, partial [Candidatus Saccharibacteria bacterium]|nr:hypothetical protein [Candidatus Saccharibacteria bacterium]